MGELKPRPACARSSGRYMLLQLYVSLKVSFRGLIRLHLLMEPSAIIAEHRFFSHTMF